MFTCQQCKHTVPAGVKATHIVVETRPRSYPARKYVHRFAEDRKLKYNDDPGGHGYETVREILVCPDCAAVMKQK